MSPDTSSTITDAVLDEVMLWQNRQFDPATVGSLGLPGSSAGNLRPLRATKLVVHTIPARDRSFSYHETWIRNSRPRSIPCGL